MLDVRRLRTRILRMKIRVTAFHVLIAIGLIVFQPQSIFGTEPLTTADAARLAATLANEECNRLYQQTPFLPEHFTPKLVEGRWVCGGLDPGGPAGFSAAVTFRQDGSTSSVHVYFSSDTL
jgi:hypothetical protein